MIRMDRCSDEYNSLSQLVERQKWGTQLASLGRKFLSLEAATGKVLSSDLNKCNCKGSGTERSASP